MYRNHLVVTEQFTRRHPYKKSKGGKRIFCRKLALEMDMSFSNAYRILRKDIKMKPYNIAVEPPVKDEHKAQWKKIANRMKRKFQKEDTMRILFSNEQMFDLDGIYSSQNGRIWAAQWTEKGGQEQFSDAESILSHCYVHYVGPSEIRIF